MQLHYFQRYHQKENVDTSNTMLMLSRLYHHNADKFYMMLQQAILSSNENPELKFELQVSGDGSVPDAVISQKSFKVVVETKLNNQFTIDQLQRHLKQFDNEDIKVLLTLDPEPMQENLKNDFKETVKEYNTQNKEKFKSEIQHVNLTFETLLKAMEDIVDDRDLQIVDVLDDFRRYCFEQGLITDGYKWMRAIVAGTTLEDNLALNLYYDRGSVGFSNHGYIGLYSQKSVRAIGKLTKIIKGQIEDGKLRIEAVKNLVGNEDVTEDERKRIEDAIEKSKSHGYNIGEESHNYFMVEKFHEIDFRKDSKFPIQKSKLFNLADMFGYAKMPETEKIASDLDGEIWGDFS